MPDLHWDPFFVASVVVALAALVIARAVWRRRSLIPGVWKVWRPDDAGGRTIAPTAIAPSLATANEPTGPVGSRVEMAGRAQPPARPADPCGAELSGFFGEGILCARPAGHDLPHRSTDGTEWAPRCDSVMQGLGGGWDIPTRCTLPTGHDLPHRAGVAAWRELPPDSGGPHRLGDLPEGVGVHLTCWQAWQRGEHGRACAWCRPKLAARTDVR